MKKLSSGLKIKLGLLLLAVSFLLKLVSIDQFSSYIPFLQGFCVGLGIALLIFGTIEKRKTNT